jgi:hypothetical protein
MIFLIQQLKVGFQLGNRLRRQVILGTEVGCKSGQSLASLVASQSVEVGRADR